MKINKLNYENFVIDYIEGTLSIELKKEFDVFLENHKEVYDEIKDYMSAPILEEPEVIYTDKKVILQKSKNGKYALLALIPVLLIGAYLFFGSTNQETTPVADKKKTEVGVLESQGSEGQMEEDKNTDSQMSESQRSDVRESKVKETEVRKSEGQMEEVKKKEEIEPTLKKENFELEQMKEPSEIEKRFAAVTPLEEVKDIRGKDLINNPMEIGTLNINFDFDSKFTSSKQMSFAEVKSFNGSEENKIDIQNRSRGWLELITPASFEDIDLKESLAIQTNVDINSSRKFLNAFIPESIVK